MSCQIVVVSLIYSTFMSKCDVSCFVYYSSVISLFRFSSPISIEDLSFEKKGEEDQPKEQTTGPIDISGELILLFS